MAKRFLIIGAFIVGGMLGIEAVNTIRICIKPDTNRTFPQGYVSRGVWSFGAFIRPLDQDSTDITPAMKAAVKIVRRDPDLYSDFNPSGSGFIYPPSAAVGLAPFGLAIGSSNGDISVGISLMDLLGRLSVVGTIVIGLCFLRGVIPSWKYWIGSAVVLGAFYPLRWMVMCVQAQSLITILLAGAIIAYARSRNTIAGVFAGLAICLKPHLGLLFLFACLRKEWRFLAGMAAGCTVIVLASLAIVGIEPWRIYLKEIAPALSAGYAYYPNQSINGIVNRWLGHSPIFLLAPPSEIASLATKFAVVVFGLLAICPRSLIFGNRGMGRLPAVEHGVRDSGVLANIMYLRALDVGLALLAIMLASPISWEHHFAWSIVLFSTCLAVILSRPLSVGIMVVLAIGYILLGTYFHPVEGASSGWPSLVNSPHFFGAVLLMISAWYTYILVEKEMVSTECSKSTAE